MSVASCERSFSKLKLIKSYLRSTMGQSRLSDLAILSIESDTVKDIDFDEVIDRFAVLKSRKGHFKIKYVKYKNNFTLCLLQFFITFTF